MCIRDRGVGVGQVDARLDDGGAHQHVQLPVGHPAHHLVDGLLGHLAVGHPHRRILPQHGLDAAGGAVDGLHSVVEVVPVSYTHLGRGRDGHVPVAVSPDS